MSPFGEPKYFAYDKSNPNEFAKGIFDFEKYSDLFNDVKNEKAIGEASPQYFTRPLAAKNIKKYIPEVKLIVSLRNPIERSYSHYLMDVRQGRENKPFLDAFFEKNNGHYKQMVKHGLYYSNLTAWYDSFLEDQMKIVFFEDLISNPKELFKEIFDFLGVDNASEIRMDHQNKGGVPRNRMLYALLRSSVFAKVKKKVSKAIKLRYLRGVIDKLYKHNMERVEMPKEAKRVLVDFYREEILKTQNLTERDLSSWLE